MKGELDECGENAGCRQDVLSRFEELERRQSEELTAACEADPLSPGCLRHSSLAVSGDVFIRREGAHPLVSPETEAMLSKCDGDLGCLSDLGFDGETLEKSDFDNPDPINDQRQSRPRDRVSVSYFCDGEAVCMETLERLDANTQKDKNYGRALTLMASRIEMGRQLDAIFEGAAFEKLSPEEKLLIISMAGGVKGLKKGLPNTKKTSKNKKLPTEKVEDNDVPKEYDVDEYGKLKSKDKPGDGLDNHHVPQKDKAKKQVEDYPQDNDAKTAPAIRIEKITSKNNHNATKE